MPPFYRQALLHWRFCLAKAYLIVSATASPRPLSTYVLLLALYLAQGLPVGFITQALPVILREQQASLVVIGWSGLLLLPWAVKFAWAPLQDRYYWPQVGLGRSWILPTQVLTLLAVAGLVWQEPALLRQPHTALAFVALLVLVGLAGAVQDVATDGLAVRLLTQGERSMGNAIQVAGSRLGMILGGGGVLLLLDHTVWRTVMLLMLALVLLTTLPVLWFREPDWHALHRPERSTGQPLPGPADLASAGVGSLWQRVSRLARSEFGYFWATPALRAWLWVLLAYKLCDGLSSGMVKPMLVDMGYSKSQIGVMVTMLGAGASLLGAVAGHAVLRRTSRYRALLGFNALQALTTGCYALIFAAHAGRVSVADGFSRFDLLVYGLNALEHFAAGMALVGMLTTVMDHCRHRNGGSDFTVQVSIMAAASGAAHWASGYLAQGLGFVWHYVLCMVLGLVLLWPVVRWQQMVRQDTTVRRPANGPLHVPDTPG